MSNLEKLEVIRSYLIVLQVIRKDFFHRLLKKIYNICVLWYNISKKEGIS